ncbi:MAG: 4'-phosphopantetheinyl transferase [Psychromonas sp.]
MLYDTGEYVFSRNSASILALQNNNIHLWTIDPQAVNETSVLNSLKNLLPPAEIERINRYRFPKAQHTALITRAFVRLVLSQYAQTAPQDWLFTISEHGKPELKNAPFALRFNLSHNDNLVICSVCLNHDIGCDVESLSRKISVEAISKRYFSASEYQNIKKLAPELQRAGFFEYWTLKEAFVKATGFGISQGLDTFSFEIGQAEPRKFNDNISLSFSPKSPVQNNQDWYSCLTYPDQTHCVAICINSGQLKHDFKLDIFSASELLSVFNGA